MKIFWGLVGLSLVCATGCAESSDEPAQESDLTSKSHTFYDLTFSGSVVADQTDDAEEIKKSVVTQLFYMSGELDKVHGGHGRFGFVELENVVSEPVDDELSEVRYEATLQIALPKYKAAPESYRVVVPKRVDDTGLREFNNKYSGTCGKAKYGSDSLWYDFEPVTTACEMDAGDILDTEAAVAASDFVNETRYPEYDRFWEDGEFRAVIVHGTDSSWSKDPDDIGVAQYIEFQEILARELPGAEITLGDSSSDIYEDWQLEARIETPDGGEAKIVVNLLLTASLKSIGSTFDERFDEVTAKADLIMYGGHSGLSKNIKALAAKGVVEAGRYQVFFIDGCSTFAYLDSTLVDRRIEVNGPEVDPSGTKFLDVIINAQPVPWYSGADNLWHILDHMTGGESTFYDVISTMSQAGSPVVTGEEDNPDTL